MAVVDYRSLAAGIVQEVGGEDNIASATHCATRLRLKLRDDSKADKAAVEKLPGVITVMQAGGQYQVVIGDNVPTVYAELGKITKFGDEDASAGGDVGTVDQGDQPDRGDGDQGDAAERPDTRHGDPDLGDRAS